MASRHSSILHLYLQPEFRQGSDRLLRALVPDEDAADLPPLPAAILAVINEHIAGRSVQVLFVPKATPNFNVLPEMRAPRLLLAASGTERGTAVRTIGSYLAIRSHNTCRSAIGGILTK